MAITRLIGVALVCAVIVVYLKNTKPELAFGAAAASSVILLLMIIAMLSGVFEFFESLTERSGLESGLIKTVLKIIGIGYLTEFSASLIEDFGSKAIADKLILGGKIVILVLSLPILKSMLDLIVSILE